MTPGMNLDEYQARAKATDKNKHNDGNGRMARVLGLASETGAVLETYKRRFRDNLEEKDMKPILLVELGDVLWFTATIAAANDLTLQEIAEANLKRAADRYDKSALDKAPVFGAGFPPEQSFPRKLVVEFAQSTGTTGRKRSEPTLIHAHPNAFPAGSSKVKGENGKGKRLGYDVGKPMGDPLTDNVRRDKEDGYRFHDAIHLSFMANLGWSPVMRYILRVKRKADEDTEEGEDSVRQVLNEEGLAAVLQQMSKRRMGFRNARGVNDEVMEVVRAITKDAEVSSCSDALWGKAISEGFTVMNQLAANGGGFAVADLDKRSLTFSKTKPKLT